MAESKSTRVALQFFPDDFRHREVLAILRKRPRSMTDFVVTAISHYVRCPYAENDGLDRELVRSIVKEVLQEMAEHGELSITPANSKGSSPDAPSNADLSDLSDVMDMFRR